MMAGDQGFSLAITCMGGNLGYFERKTKHCHQAKEKNTGYFFTSLPTEKNINSPKNTQILLHSVFLENKSLMKFIQNYIRDPSAQ